LIAPFLIDGLLLQQRVVSGRLTDALLPALAHLQVDGIAFLPGELERPFGLERRLLGPSDYRGAVIGVTRAPVATLTFAALGAVPRAYPPGELPPWRFTGAELDLTNLEGGQYAVFGRSSVTANVVFWPRIYTVVGNRSVLAELTPEQREVLRKAGREAVAPAIARLREEDRAEATALCLRDRVSFVEASGSQVSALRAAARPVYAKLERDPATLSLVARIAALRRATAPDTPLRCITPPGLQQAASLVDGTWEMTAPRTVGQIDAGRYRLILRRGRVVLYHLSPPKWGGPPSGVLTIRRHTLEFRFPNGEVGVYRWNVYRDTLTLRAVPGVASAPNPTFAPWHRVR
jgi:hypothetical protein